MRLDFDPAAHEYRLDGALVPSVTQVIASLYDHSAIPSWVLDRKAAIGTAVHLACELDDDGELDEESVDPVVAPYLGAWRLFRKESGAEILLNEHQLGDPVLRYAGTCDRVIRYRGALWAVDLKTTVAMDPAIGVQLAGYARLVNQSGLVGACEKRAAVQLRNDGTYRFSPFESPDDERCFLSLLNVAHWRSKHHV